MLAECLTLPQYIPHRLPSLWPEQLPPRPAPDGTRLTGEPTDEGEHYHLFLSCLPLLPSTSCLLLWIITNCKTVMSVGALPGLGFWRHPVFTALVLSSLQKREGVCTPARTHALMILQHAAAYWCTHAQVGGARSEKRANFKKASQRDETERQTQSHHGRRRKEERN